MNSQLAVTVVSRRAISVAVFSDHNLNYAETKHLSSNLPQALDSSSGFIRWVIAKFRVSLVGMQGADEPETRSAELISAIVALLREEGIPVWAAKKQELFEAFATPPLKSRQQLRTVASWIWPVIERTPENDFLLDALVIGLYIQTERMFRN